MCASFCVIHAHKQKVAGAASTTALATFFNCAVGPYCFAGGVFSVLLFFFASSG